MSDSPLTALRIVSPAPSHVAYVDGLRAMGAIFVILHHCLMQVDIETMPVFAWLGKNAYYFIFGHYRVDLFLVLSGFCLAAPVVKRDGHIVGGILNFFQKRARRILPPYFFGCTFSLLLIWLLIGQKTGTLWDTCTTVNPKILITHLLLIQDLFSDTSSKINYPYWSISVEWRIYFLFPLLMALRRRWGMWKVAALTLLVSYGMLFIGQHSSLADVLNLGNYGINPQYLGLFALGILGADVAQGKSALSSLLQRPVYAASLLGVTTLLMLGTSVVKLRHGEILPMAYADFFVGVWAASLMVAAANTKIVGLNRMLSWRPLVFIGTFAYSIYLVHAPIIQVVWQYLLFPLQNDDPSMFLGLCFVATPLVLAVSYCFFLVCERPFLNKRKKETMAETERDAVLAPAP